VATLVTIQESKYVEEEEEFNRLRKSHCIYLKKTTLMKKYRLSVESCSYLSWQFGDQLILS